MTREDGQDARMSTLPSDGCYSLRENVIRELKPYEVVVRFTFALGGPATVVTPVFRRLRRRTGAQIGSGVVSLINVAVNVALLRVARRKGLTPKDINSLSPRERRVAALALLWSLAGPPLAGLSTRNVVFHGGSPFLAYPIEPFPVTAWPGR